MLFTLFFFNDTATTEIYTLSLHDALPICPTVFWRACVTPVDYDYLRKLLKDRSGLVLSADKQYLVESRLLPDRKSTRLNSSHSSISYAVFCLKKKKKKKKKHIIINHTLSH